MSKNLDIARSYPSTHISAPTSYHIYNGSLALASTTSTNGFSTTLYTGNGSTQSINTGIDMATQWGNDVSEQFGGLVWCKARSIAYPHYMFDTARGEDYWIRPNDTIAQTNTNVIDISSSGFSINGNYDINQSGATNVSWNFQTTHRTSGTTNHGKPYTCHYNPFTGFTIVKYEGSGIAGHEIPHHLGRKLGFEVHKNLTNASNWIVLGSLFLNNTNAGTPAQTSSDLYGFTSWDGDNQHNASTNQYILYGWANSYFDEANTLIGNYEVGVYQGTGASGNKVVTRGKPAWVMLKRLDALENWAIVDNSARGYKYLYPNLSATESSGTYLIFNSSDFTLTSSDVTVNASGGQYLYMVVYDNDNGSGKTKYPKPTDSPVLNLNATVPLAKGIDSKGSKNSIQVLNETVTGVTLTAGKNYLYKTDSGYGVSKYAPQYNSYNGFGDYFDVNSNKWYSGLSVFSDDCNSTSGWTTTNGTTTSVEGKLKLVTTGGAYASARKACATIIGKTYKVVVNKYANGGINPFLDIRDGGDISVIIRLENSNLSYETATFVATHTNHNIGLGLYSTSAGTLAMFDNIAVYPIKADGTPDLSNATEITSSRNYLDAIVYADTTGNATVVEQLPKTVYVDEIKANEFKGKNACTAWVNFDGTTTPPTIRDSYNVSSVVRTATGAYTIYFTTPMDNVNYSITEIASADGVSYEIISISTNSFITQIVNAANNGLTNVPMLNIQIFGGKNV